MSRTERAAPLRRLLWALAILAGLGALSFATPGPTGAQRASRVEGVAAIVGGRAPGPSTQVILRSDVELRARIAVSGRTARLAMGPLPPGLLRAVLDQMIGYALITREATRLRAPSPSEGDIRAARDALAREAGGAPRLAAIVATTGATDEEINAFARRRAYVDAFLRTSAEGSVVVGDVAVQRAYERGEHPFGDRPLPEVQEEIRGWLAQRRLRRHVRRLIEVLRARTTVVDVSGWAAGSAD